MQAHTDNGPIFSPPWSPARPVIKVGVAEELEVPGSIVLTLQAHDPQTGLLISHFELVRPPKPPSTPFFPPEAQPPEGTASTSLFDGLRLETLPLPSPGTGTASAEDPNDVLSFIELNTLTGEISFKKRVDYEQLTNKV